jgi:hypothetical protein
MLDDEADELVIGVDHIAVQPLLVALVHPLPREVSKVAVDAVERLGEPFGDR